MKELKIALLMFTTLSSMMPPSVDYRVVLVRGLYTMPGAIIKYGGQAELQGTRYHCDLNLSGDKTVAFFSFGRIQLPKNKKSLIVDIFLYDKYRISSHIASRTIGLGSEEESIVLIEDIRK